MVKIKLKKIDKKLNLKKFYFFIDQHKKSIGTSEAALVRIYYEDLFQVFPPWHEYPFEFVVLKIKYKLLRDAYKKAALEMPNKVKQNYLATKKFKVKKLTKSMKELYDIYKKYSEPCISLPEQKKFKVKINKPKTFKLKIKRA